MRKSKDRRTTEIRLILKKNLPKGFKERLIDFDEEQLCAVWTIVERVDDVTKFMDDLLDEDLKREGITRKEFAERCEKAQKKIDEEPESTPEEIANAIETMKKQLGKDFFTLKGVESVEEKE